MPTGLDEVTATATALSILEAAVSIIKIVAEVFAFSKQCRHLASTCAVVKLVLARLPEIQSEAESNDQALEHLDKILTKCDNYLKECKDRRFIRNPVFEVTFHRRIDKYRSLCYDWIMTAIFSLQVSNLSASRQTAGRMETNWQSILERLDLSRRTQYHAPQETIQDIPTISNVHAVDERHSGVHSQFDGALDSGEAVTCVPLKILYREDAPKIILNYSYLSAALHVQKFYGIFEDSTGKYSIIENLKKQIRLRDLFDHGIFLSAFIQKKLRLCYEIANTVAYFHSVKLVVKVISESTIFIRFKGESMLPVFSDLEQSRVFLYPTDDTSIDLRYEPLEYLEAKIHSKSSDVWSLGIVIWQILEGKALSENETPMTLHERYKNLEINSVIRRAVGDCLNPIPSTRPNASVVAQRLLDLYNDSCAANLRPKKEAEPVLSLRELCRHLIEESRLNPNENHQQMLTSDETDLLFQLEDSWDEPGALRLAPEISFIIGAGILYGFIDLEDVKKHNIVIVQELKSQKRNKINYAVSYLNEALNMGYVEASTELVIAYREMAKSFSREGSKAIQHKRATNKISDLPHN